MSTTFYITEAPALVHDDLPWLVLKDDPLQGRLVAAFGTYGDARRFVDG
jgi:hypothetical protein